MAPLTRRQFLKVAAATALEWSLLSEASSSHGPNDDFLRGIAYTSWWKDEYSTLSSKPKSVPASIRYSTASSRQSLAELKNTDANSITLLVTQYVDTISSPTIHPVADKTPTDQSLNDAIADAKSFGLEVILKPHVDVLAGDWRGYIQFSTESAWANWFSSYRSFINHYADLARTNGLKLFCVGTELKGTTQRPEWQTVIYEARQHFLGQMTYAANWDDFDKIDWVSLLDYIGVDAYFPLTASNNPPVSQLVSAWEPHISRMDAVQKKFGKDIILTEIGYVSADGTNKAPYSQLNTALDIGEQRDCYEAAFRALWNLPWLKGLFFWNWTTDPNQGGLADKDYTPHGKPAEQVLKNWFSKERKITAADPICLSYE